MKYGDNYRDERRSVVSKQLKLAFGKEELIVTLSRKSSPVILVSVFRSAFLSLPDIVDRLRNGSLTWDFLAKVVWPRSQPFLFFALAIVVVMWLTYRSAAQRQSKILELQSLHEESLVELHRTQDDVDRRKAQTDELAKKELELQKERDTLVRRLVKQMTEYDDSRRELADELAKKELELQKERDSLEQRLVKQRTEYDDGRRKLADDLAKKELELQKDRDSLEQRLVKQMAEYDEGRREFAEKDKELESTKSQLAETKAKLAEAEEKEMTLLNEAKMAARRAQQIELEPKKDKALNKDKIISALLENPELRLGDGAPKVNPGAHHSKDYVKQVGEAISRIDRVARLVKTVSATHYDSKNRNRGFVECDHQRRGYVLKLYSGRDEGFGVEILLNAEKSWQAMVEAKCLVRAVPLFENFKLIDKTE